MAEIREELTLVDKFSETFNKFNEAVQKLTSMTDEMQKSGSDNNKQFKDMNDWFGKNNDAAQRLADRGLNALTKRLVVMAGAYVGIRKLTQAIQEAGAVSDQVGRLGSRTGRFNDAENMGIIKGIANTYGTDMGTAGQMQFLMTKITGNEDMQKRMLSLASRISAITPNSTTESVLSGLTSSLQSGSVGDFIEQYGLRRTDAYDPRRTAYANFQGQFGNINEGLKYLEEMSEQAGATEQALSRMWDNPHQKMHRLANIWNNELTSAAQSFMTAIKPALDKLEAFFQSQQFASFMGMVSQVFAMFGKLFEQLISKLVANAPMITDMLAKAFTVLYNVLGWVIDHFDTTATVVGLMIAGFVAWKVAIMGVNTAMTILNGIKLVFSNPFTAIIASCVAFVTILEQMFNPEQSPVISFLNALSLIANAIASPFIAIRNAVVALMTTFEQMARNFIEGGLLDAIEKFNGMSGPEKWTKGLGGILGVLPSSLGNAFKTQTAEEKAEIDAKMWGFENVNLAEMIGNLFTGKMSALDFEKNINAIIENTKTVSDNTGALGLMNANLDPDSWMKNFEKVAMGQMERNTTFSIMNNMASPTATINVNNNGGSGRMTGREVAEIVKDWLEMEATAGGGIPSHI